MHASNKTGKREEEKTHNPTTPTSDMEAGKSLTISPANIVQKREVKLRSAEYCGSAKGLQIFCR